MTARLVRTLPWLSAAGLAASAVSVLFWSPGLARVRTDTGETRPVVARRAADLAGRRPASLDDPSFRAAVLEFQRSAYVAGVTLFDAGGRILYASGATSAATPAGQMAEDLATEETTRVVAAVGDTLTAQQKTAVLAAAAIMREGEHNDILRHLVRPVERPDGSLAGYLGVTYAANPALGGPVAARYVAGLLLFAAGLAGYWLLLPLWVFFDGRARGERAWLWAAFVLVGNAVALIAYLLTRTPPARRPAGAR
jgi:hypothetical protein